MEQQIGRTDRNDAIRRLEVELEKIRVRLGALADDGRESDDGLEEPPVTDIDPTVLLATARHIQRVRQRRQRHLPAELFGEPSWDILIDLYIVVRTGKRLTVSAACINAMVPPTTALRHIRVLVEHGLVRREPDVSDGRRVWLSLSSRTIGLMECCLAEASHQGPA